MIEEYCFIPGGPVRLTYAMAINQAMKEPGIINREHDIEPASEVRERFRGYIEKQPERIHAAPYLLKLTGMEAPNLVWAHRLVKIQRVKDMPITDEKKQKLTNLFPSTDDKGQPIEMAITYPVWIQGGETETDYFALGYTYIPKRIWDECFWRVSETDWLMIDSRLSEACMLKGEKALIHWDCLVNHTGIMRNDELTTFNANRA